MFLINRTEQWASIYYIVFYSSTIQFSYHLRLVVRYQALASWQRSTILPLALVLLHFSFCHLGAGTSSFQNLLIGLSSRALDWQKMRCSSCAASSTFLWCKLATLLNPKEKMGMYTYYVPILLGLGWVLFVKSCIYNVSVCIKYPSFAYWGTVITKCVSTFLQWVLPVL